MSRLYRTPVPLLQQIIDEEHFLECQAMEVLEPSDDARMDLRFAMLCSVIANNSIGRKTVAKVEDFLLDFTDKEPKDSDDVQEQVRNLKDVMRSRSNRPQTPGMRRGE